MEKIESYDWQEVIRRAQAGRPRKYDWDKYLDGNIYRVTRGVDFDCQVTGFAQGVRNMAKEYGLYVRIRREGDDSLVFQASTEPFIKPKQKKMNRTMYQQAVRYASRRDVITQRELRGFFKVGRRIAKRLVDQLLADGYLDEFDSGKGGYPTRFQIAKNTITVTTTENSGVSV